MARVTLLDLIEETTETTGTGPITLLGAVAGNRFALPAEADGLTCDIVIESATAVEVVRGVYTHSGRTFSRDEVIRSSNADALVDWPAGVKKVRVVASSALVDVFAGLGQPSKAGSAATPGIEIGEHGTGLFFVADTDYRRVGLSLDETGYLAVVEAATYQGIGWNTNLPGQAIGAESDHNLTGSVVHIYDAAAEATLLIEGIGSARLQLQQNTPLQGRFEIVAEGPVLVIRRLTFDGSDDIEMLRWSGNSFVQIGAENGIASANIKSFAAGSSSIAVGHLAGENGSSSTHLCVLVGNSAGNLMSGTRLYTTFVGGFAGRFATGTDFSTYVGGESGLRIVGAQHAAALGYQTLGGELGSGLETTGSHNTAVGSRALSLLEEGENNTAVGSGTGRAIVDGSGNVLLGKEAAEYLGDVSHVFAVGYGPTESETLLLGNMDDSTGRFLQVLGDLEVDEDVEVAGDVNILGQLFLPGGEVLAGGGGSGDFAVLEADLSIWVSPSGDDGNDGLDDTSPVETIAKALELAGGYYIPSPWTLYIELMPGLHDADATITPVHPQSERLVIRGEKTTVGLLNGSYISGSAGSRIVGIQMTAAHGLAVGDFVLITDASGGTNPHHVKGVWPVTTVTDSTLVRVTTTILGSQTPSIVNAGTVHCMKTRVAGNWVIPLAGDRVTLKDFVSVGSGTGTGVTVSAGARVICEGLGIHGWLINMSTQSGSVADLQTCALCGAANTALVMLGTDLFCEATIFSGNVDYGIEPSTSRMTAHGSIFVGNRRSMFFRGGSCDATGMQVLSHAENAINGSSMANMDVRDSTIRDCGGNGVVSTYYAFIDARTITFAGISGLDTSAANGGNIRT